MFGAWLNCNSMHTGCVKSLLSYDAMTEKFAFILFFTPHPFARFLQRIREMNCCY